MPTLLRRTRVRALVLLVSAVLSVGAAVAFTAPAATALAPASAAHPFSDPVYWPMRASVNMDCFQNNPGCRTPHKYWMMDVVPNGQGRVTSRAGVYSMGAGVVHIGDATGARCGKENSYGTWIWIDHGAGTLSRYGHLSKITVRAGQYVAAGQQIGVVGTTGKRANCHVSYVNFSVQRNGLKTSHGVEFRTLVACNARSGRGESWPSAFSGASRWENVRQSTVIPAASSACLPKAAPATALRPAKIAIARGKGKLRVGWTRPPASSRVNAVKVEVGEWHTGGKYWDLPRNSRWVQVSPSTTSVLVGKLTKKRLHRVRVSFHNAKGWSAPTAWRQVKTK